MSINVLTKIEVQVCACVSVRVCLFACVPVCMCVYVCACVIVSGASYCSSGNSVTAVKAH